MKVHVINLDRRPDRLAFFRDQAAARGFEFERIVAVDGTDPALVARAAALPAGFTGHRRGPFQLACFESHRLAWRAVLDSGDACGIVMEDDVVLAEDFRRLLADGWVPQDADLVRLETYMTPARFDAAPAGQVAGRAIRRMRSTMGGAGAYVIARPAAARLLQATETLFEGVDEVMFNTRSPLFGQLAIYQLIPAPAIQGHRLPPVRGQGWAESSLQAERTEDEGGVPAQTGLRRFKLYWRAQYWMRRLKARARGRIDVPFG